MIRIGTSGWTYADWKGAFYPQKVPQRKWLEHYATVFDAVELNATFYRIPKAGIAEGWRDRTPSGFGFAIKMPRLVSHVHRLRECGEVLEWFFRDLAPLSAKTLACLIQLPPGFLPERPVLEDFLRMLPSDRRFVVEVRDERCHAGYVPELLVERGVGFCIHDLPSHSTPALVTSPVVYLRFHGYGKRYGGSYPREVLEGWARRIRTWASEGRDVLAFFNNDRAACAPADAAALRALVQPPVIASP